MFLRNAAIIKHICGNSQRGGNKRKHVTLPLEKRT